MRRTAAEPESRETGTLSAASDGDEEIDPIGSPRVPGARIALGLLLVAIVGGAVVYRFWLTLGPLGRTPNSDEAIVGLMALHLVHAHELRAFYWNQFYGGSLESFLVAPFVWVLGTTTLALRFASVVLALTAPVLTWRIARHLFDRRVAVAAGLLALWWPLALVYFGTQERGFYPLAVALGLAAVLLALDVDEQPRRLRFWLGLGFVVGVAWWVSPNALYYAVPVVLFLLARGHWRQWRNIAGAAVAFGAGSSVWTIANVHTHFASLRVARGLAGTSTFGSRFGLFWQKGLPFALGLRRPWDSRWYFSPLLGRTIYGAVLVVLVVCVAKALSSRPIDVLLVAVAPLVFAAFPQTWQLSEGRYTYVVASMLPILLCRVLQHRVAQVGALVLVVAAGVAFARDYRRLSLPIAASIVPITRDLERDGYRTAVANYWIAFRIDYQSGERVIATPLPGEPGVRYRPYVRTVQDSVPAYVFNLRGQYSNDRTLLQELDRSHVPYRVVVDGGYYAVLPERHVIVLP